MEYGKPKKLFRVLTNIIFKNHKHHTYNVATRTFCQWYIYKKGKSTLDSNTNAEEKSQNQTSETIGDRKTHCVTFSHGYLTTES